MDWCLLNDDLVENPNLMENILTALSNAWDAADEKAQVKIKYIKEMMEYLKVQYH